MKINRKRMRIVAAVVATAAPALLFASGGTANAVPGQGIDVSWSPSPIGLTATVANKTQYPGRCTYDATVINLPLPPYHHEFDLPAFQKVSWLIPSIATGTTWRTVVRCGDPTNLNIQRGYFEHTSSY